MAKLKAIDTIGELDAQIAALEKKKAKLVQRIKDYRGVGTYQGDLYEATVYEATSTKPNIPKLQKKLGADWHKFLTKKTMVCLRVTKQGKKPKKAVE